MRIMRNSLFVFSVILALTCLVYGQNQKPSFAISIKAPQNVVREGAKAIIEITVSNISDHVVRFSGEGGSPDWGAFDFGFDVRDSSGSRPLETNYFKAAQGEEQGPGPQVTLDGGGLPNVMIIPLDGGESGADLPMNTRTDLARLFKLTPGTYTVQIWRSREGLKMVGGKPEVITSGHIYEDSTKPIVRSNTITITVIP
jgi:hypothetical protein